jgi:hypothetical protein
MNRFSIKDLKKALNYFEEKFKTVNVDLEVDDMCRLHLSTNDLEANHVQITIYRSNDEVYTKMPELTETKRF